ncbi:MAG: DUF502 domain-containing protein, partial [Candidatus Zixiibacteriota bacterium]
ISGVLVVVPIILTYIVLKFLFESFDGILQPIVQRVFGYSVFGLGILTTLLLIILAGIFTRNIIGAKLYQIGDRILIRMPIIRPIYSAAKQLLEAISLPSVESFKEVVLVEYPRRGTYALSFISNHIEIEVDGTIKKYVSVFVPSTPTPVSGMVIIVPVEEVIPVNMTVEEGVKFLVSGGVASPSLLKKKNKQIINDDKEVTREAR